MKAATTILATAAMATMSASGFAADTAEERYGSDKICAAVITAALEQNALPASVTAEQATSLQAVYARQAQASGRAAGVQPEKVVGDIDAMHRTIVTRMNAPDPARAGAERADAAKMTTNCAALLGMSLLEMAEPHQ